MDKCVEVIDTLILPYISYGLIAWGNASNAYLNKILVLRKRVLRLIYFADRREDAIPLFVKAKILPVTFLYYHRDDCKGKVLRSIYCPYKYL